MRAQQPGPADGVDGLGCPPHHGHPGATGRYKGVLRRLCTEIMSPNPAKSATPKYHGAAAVKGIADRGLVSALRRGAVPRWVASYAGRDAAPGAKGNDYASSKDSTSCTTLVGSMLSGGADAGQVGGPESVGQQAPAVAASGTGLAPPDSTQDPHPMTICLTGDPAMRGQQRLRRNPHASKATSPRHAACAHVPGPRPNNGIEGISGRRFNVGRNPQFTGVLDVTSARTDQTVYRRIIHNGKLWCASFHRVAGSGSSSRGVAGGGLPCVAYDFCGQGLALDVCGGSGSTRWSPRSPMSYCAEGGQEWAAAASFCSPPLAPSFAPPSPAFASASDQRVSVRQSRQQQQQQQQHPWTYEKNRLWEISSPQPDVFPLHCRDTRGVLDPVPLTPMVLDRHQFCYRFYLAGHKMRWQAKLQGRATVELQCYVRSTVVALLVFDSHSASVVVGPATRNTSSGSSVWPGRRLQTPQAHSACAANSASAVYERSDCHPRTTPAGQAPPRINMASVVILPEAFIKLATVDSAIAESFVLFTGIVVYERFLCTL